VHTGFLWVNLKGGDHLEDSGVDGGIILKIDLREMGWGMDWIEFVEDRDSGLL
jgi:hypothetical protein